MKTISTISSIFAIGVLYFLVSKWFFEEKISLDLSDEEPVIYL
ncbi:hypothetical protein [Rufibacter radiotolerans]|jgi:hypothetical protein|nr:hypothetical protein [Rufibacter radiotolerans]